MDRTAIYHKSARGAEAIATRGAALPIKLRSMLILVNGRRPFEELLKLGQGLGDPVDLLVQLEAEGFIEPGPPRPGPPSEPAPLFPHSGLPPLESASAPAPLDFAPRTVPLGQAQQHAMRRLNDLMGPTADDLCQRIAAARSPQEFEAAIRRTEAILREVVGPELAAQFVSAVGRLRLA